MCVKSEQAIDLYNKACLCEEQGKAVLAEVYYLKSWSLFEQAGGSHSMHAANALNALAFFRWSRKDYEGALRAARESIQVMDVYRSEYAGADVELIRSTSWELIDQVCYEMRLFAC